MQSKVIYYNLKEQNVKHGWVVMKVWINFKKSFFDKRFHDVIWKKKTRFVEQSDKLGNIGLTHNYPDFHKWIDRRYAHPTQRLMSNICVPCSLFYSWWAYNF